MNFLMLLSRGLVTGTTDRNGVGERRKTGETHFASKVIG